MDGITLEGWYIPAKNSSNKIVICNHFSPGNRYGYAGHIKPWRKAGGFEVNFLPKYKALVDAGYNVLAYDLRNHGFSAPAQNGGYNPQLFEYKDVIGSLNYVKSRKKIQDMEVHLHSMCLGGNSTLVAMRKHPEIFEGVKSMILIQPISGEALVKKLCKNMRVGQKGYNAFQKYYQEIWGYRISDSSPQEDAPFVKIPTFVVQVKKDSFTYAEDDVQAIYDAIPIQEKKIFWIKGTTQRFHGYTYFSENPRPMLEWYDKYSS
jgi:pimeloyl-ACP methyl ester carboxylesterase